MSSHTHCSLTDEFEAGCARKYRRYVRKECARSQEMISNTCSGFQFSILNDLIIIYNTKIFDLSLRQCSHTSAVTKKTPIRNSDFQYPTK